MSWSPFITVDTVFVEKDTVCFLPLRYAIRRARQTKHRGTHPAQAPPRTRYLPPICKSGSYA